MTLDELFKHGQEAAKLLFEKQGSIQPMWICEAENGEMIPICIRMPDRDDRDALSEAIKATFKRHRVVRYVSLLESWMIATDKNAKPDLTQSLEFHPDRCEVVFLAAEDADGQERCGHFPILRPEHDKPTLGAFKEILNSQGSNGRFAKMLRTTEH